MLVVVYWSDYCWLNCCLFLLLLISTAAASYCCWCWKLMLVCCLPIAVADSWCNLLLYAGAEMLLADWDPLTHEVRGRGGWHVGSTARGSTCQWPRQLAVHVRGSGSCWGMLGLLAAAVAGNQAVCCWNADDGRAWCLDHVAWTGATPSGERDLAEESVKPISVSSFVWAHLLVLVRGSQF